MSRNQKIFTTIAVIVIIILLLRNCAGKACAPKPQPPMQSTATVVEPTSPDGPGVVTNSHDKEVLVGQTLKTNVTWHKVDIAKYFLVLRLKDRYKGPSKEGRISLEKTFELASADGTGDFALPVPANTPGGTAYLDVYLRNKKEGDKDRIGGLKEDVAIKVLANVIVNSFPALVRAGTSAKINVSWKNIDAKSRTLGLKISNFTDQPSLRPIYVERFFDLKGDKGTQDFVVDVPLETSEGLCYVYAYIAPKKEGWRGRVTEMRTPDEVMTIKSVVTIRGFPAKVIAGEKAPISVAWNEIDAAKYNLTLKISNFLNKPGDVNSEKEPVYVEDRFELPSKTGTQIFNLAVPVRTVSGSCYAYAYVSPKKGSWEGRIGESKTVDNIIRVIHRLKIESHPAQVRAGSSLPVKVSWNSVDTKKFKFMMKVSNFADKPGPNPIWIENSFEIPSESGTRVFDFPIPNNTVSGKCYLLVFVAGRETGWNGRLTEVRTPDEALTVIGAGTQ